MSTINYENDAPNHPPLLQYSKTAPIETVILQQKVKRLSHLCEQHKSKYEQISAKLRMDLNKKEDEYNTKINMLQQQIKNQSLKLQCLENELQITKQQSAVKDMKHNDSIKTITSLKLQLKRRDTDIIQLQQDNETKHDEMETLKSTVYNKDAIIATLTQNLSISAAMLQLKRTDHPSPSTKKIGKSRTISISHAESLSSDQLHPDEKESPSMTSIHAKFYHRNLDIMDLSLTSSTVNKKNTDNNHTVTWALDKKKMNKPKIKVQIPSQHYLASDHDYDASDTEDYLFISVNNTPIITPFSQLKHIKEVSFPDIDVLRQSSTSTSLGLKTSETHNILDDVAANGND